MHKWGSRPPEKDVISKRRVVSCSLSAWNLLPGPDHHISMFRTDPFSLLQLVLSSHITTQNDSPPLWALLCQSVHVSLSMHLTGLRRPALHTSHPAHMTCGMHMEGRDPPISNLKLLLSRSKKTMEVLRTHIYTLSKGKCNLLWKEKLLEYYLVFF